MFIGSWLFIIQTLHHSTTSHLLRAKRFHWAARCFNAARLFYGAFRPRSCFCAFPPSCCAVLIVEQQNAKVPPNKNPTMSLFLISQSFGLYNMVFISGGSVEEGFCLRLFCINPTDNAKKNLFHFETQLNVFR